LYPIFSGFTRERFHVERRPDRASGAIDAATCPSYRSLDSLDAGVPEDEEMVTLFTDPRMLDHAPPSGHPERPERLRSILRHLERTGLSARNPVGTVRPATDEELLRVHDAGLLRLVAETETWGGGRVEVDTWTSPCSNLAARLAAGAGVEAFGHVLEEPGRRAMCLIRPPGHHARPGEPMGFCLFNNIAVAAAHARDRFGLDRILIVDFDVHHGNGTQEIFYDDPRVAFLSIHRFPFYPGTGRASETGTGPAVGTKRNVPVPFGITREEFRLAFRNALDDLADRVRPELVLISAGFDAHAEDPVGSLGLEVEDFDLITRDIVEVAEVQCLGRIVSLLEGGYNVPIMADCVATHLEALGVGQSPRERLS
jgi:acetoin utilization deacetylase AcuC-like enzyme